MRSLLMLAALPLFLAPDADAGAPAPADAAPAAPAAPARPDGPTVLMVRKDDGSSAIVDNTDEAIAQWQGYGFAIATPAQVKAEAKARAKREDDAREAALSKLVGG